MKVACLLFAIGILYPRMTVQMNQENGQAIQIVEITVNDKFQYVDDNKLEKILNSEQIKDRYVVVVSLVGRRQTGKSLMLNFFLNYLRTTYKIFNPSTNTSNTTQHWMEMNVHNGFDTKYNKSGTTKGIWAWPEIFTHDNIDGNKVAIVVLDTEGLFNIYKSLRYDTKIFALCTLFSSIEGYTVLRDVGSDTLQWLDVFTSYTVYGSHLLNTSFSPTDIPFQNFNFIARDSPHDDESQNEALHKIFGCNETHDEMCGTRNRTKSVFKTYGHFQLPNPNTNKTFDGHTTQLNHEFNNRMEKIVPEILKPENIVIKEIYGDRVKAKHLSHFFKMFTDVVEKNITVPTTLVEVLANASNWMLQEKYVKLYNDSVYEKLDAVKNDPIPFYDADKLETIHSDNKATYMAKYKKSVKFGGDEFAVPFEDLLSRKIDDCYENIKLVNSLMRIDFEKRRKDDEGFNWVMWASIGLAIGVVSIVGLYIWSRVECQNEQDEEANIDFEAEKTEKMIAAESEKK